MNLVDKINNPLKKQIRRKPTGMRTVLHLLRSGEFQFTNLTHRRLLKRAQEEGYVDENLNILKEAD